jgi:16S rRNA (cytidine1402-2'-O)-methyltransferase
MNDALNEAVLAALDKEGAVVLAPGLYVVATPIGNLSDITLRALSVLGRADIVCCEDTRHSLRLMNHYRLNAKLVPYHEHNAARERPKLLKMLSEGARIALISDAGTPLISDPGYKLVREAGAQGGAVFTVPGPCAVIAGLAVSGLPTDSFFFAGFVPPREAAAKRRLEELAEIPGTLIFFETANRLVKSLAVFGALFTGRELVIARELTKRFEEVLRVTLPAEAAVAEREWRGEFVLLVSPPPERAADEEELREAIRDAMQRASLRDAVEEVRRTLRVPRKQAYDIALEYQRSMPREGDQQE